MAVENAQGANGQPAGGNAPTGEKPAGQGAGDDQVPFLGGNAEAGDNAPPAAKPAGDKPPADGEKPKPVDGQPVPLELKLPEGFDAKDPNIAEFTKAATEAGLKPEVAQKFFDMHAAQLAKAAEPLKQAMAENEADRAKWRSEIQKDPDIGGTKLKESIALANKAMERFGGQGYLKFLRENQLVDAPEFVRAWVRVGKAMGEASSAGALNGGAPTPADSDEAFLRSMYPSMNP